MRWTTAAGRRDEREAGDQGVRLSKEHPLPRPPRATRETEASEKERSSSGKPVMSRRPDPAKHQKRGQDARAGRRHREEDIGNTVSVLDGWPVTKGTSRPPSATTVGCKTFWATSRTTHHSSRCELGNSG